MSKPIPDCPNKLAYRNHFNSDLEGKPTEELEKRIDLLQNEFDEQTKLIKEEIKKRKSLIQLENHKTQLIKFFKDYYEKNSFIYYKRTEPFFGKIRLSFYVIEIIKGYDNKCVLDNFNNVTPQIANLLNKKIFYHKSLKKYAYIKEIDPYHFDRFQIADLMRKLINHEFLMRELES